MPDLPPRPPIAKEPLSVVLPAGDGAVLLREVVAGWVPVLEGLKRDVEIIVVNDGRSADTSAAAEAVAAEFPQLHVQLVKTARGVGVAFRAGIAAAKQPLVLLAPCDPRFPPGDLSKLLEAIDQTDCVSGCRCSTPAPRALRWLGRAYRLFARVVLGVTLEPLPGWLGWKPWLFRKVVRLWTGVRIVDLNSPFKLFRRDLLTRFPIQSDGAFVHAEILAKANFLGCPLGEAKVTGPGDDPAEHLGPLLREARLVLGSPQFGPSPNSGPRKRKDKKKHRIKK